MGDYYFKGQFEPAYTVKISDQHSLTDVRVAPKGGNKFVGVGCADGSVTVLELGRTLYESSNLNAEKQAMTQLFERETNREKTLQASKLARRRASMIASKKGGDAMPQPDKEFDLTDIGSIEKDFLSFIEKNKPKPEQPTEVAEKENDQTAGNQ